MKLFYKQGAIQRRAYYSPISFFWPRDQTGFNSMRKTVGGCWTSRHHTGSVERNGWDVESCLKDPLSAHLIWDGKCRKWGGTFDPDCQLDWSERCIEAWGFPLGVTCEGVSRVDSIQELHLLHYNPLMAVYSSNRQWTGPGTVEVRGWLGGRGPLGYAFKGYILP